MKITIDGLSVSGIKKAIKQIEDYKKSFKKKNDLFVERLAELGIPIIDSNMAKAQGDSDKSHKTKIVLSHKKNTSVARLVLQGKDILFIEFGAGVFYNPDGSKHPKSSQFGYEIGTYGKGKGKYKQWYYYDDDGETKMSHGTEATMPMYRADMEIISKITQIAREVFRS